MQLKVAMKDEKPFGDALLQESSRIYERNLKHYADFAPILVCKTEEEGKEELALKAYAGRLDCVFKKHV